MIENPFSIIDRRLNRIESLLLQIKGSDQPANDLRAKQKAQKTKQEKHPVIKVEKEVSNG